MTLTIFDAESAFLDGLVQFDDWKNKFEAEWLQPLGETLIASALQSLDPEAHMMLREMNPEAYDRVVEKIGGRNART